MVFYFYGFESACNMLGDIVIPVDNGRHSATFCYLQRKWHELKFADPTVDKQVTVTASERHLTSSGHDYDAIAPASAVRVQWMEATMNCLFDHDVVTSELKISWAASTKKLVCSAGKDYPPSHIVEKYSIAAFNKLLVPIPLMQAYLCIPGSSAASEHASSVTGLDWQQTIYAPLHHGNMWTYWL
jgi:hypothetical protein